MLVDSTSRQYIEIKLNIQEKRSIAEAMLLSLGLLVNIRKEGFPLQITRQTLMNDIRLLLGHEMVDIELEPEHYNLAISLALEKIQQRSDGALEEEDIFITLQPDVQEYTLPAEVQEVRRLYRRGVGAHTAGGVNFDPVDAAFHNAFLMQPNRTGGLATWDLYSSFLETTERVFASQYNFVWYNSRKILRIIRKPRAVEDVMVRVWTNKSETSMLNDPYIKPWVRRYALAQCKGMLGQARGKFTSGLVGPGGNVSLNGDALIQQSVAELDLLEKELDNLVISGDGYGFIIG